MTQEQEKQFEELFKEKLQEQYTRGIQVGVLSTGKVVIDKFNDSSKPLMKRIEDVKRFCKAPWNKVKQAEQQIEEAKKETVDTEENSES